ncbi:MAG: hypothetical protein JWN81_778 [Solirubrobacterales bacterium]|nr:hypothetical protein [Solirubrobacterales bacterium]
MGTLLRGEATPGPTSVARQRLWACAIGATIAMLAHAAPAAALREHLSNGSFGAPGSGSGQLNEPIGVAVNDSTGAVYVADRGNNRIEEFNASGTTVLGEFNGAASPAGALSAPSWVAVDNSEEPLDPSAGDVYVVDAGHKVIDKFGPTGTYESQLSGSETGVFEEIQGVAVDRAGHLWAYLSGAEGEEGRVAEFGDTGSSLGQFNTERRAAPGFAVDASGGRVYPVFGDEKAGKLSSATGATLAEWREQFSGSSETVGAVAVDPTTGHIILDSVVEEKPAIEDYAPFAEGEESTQQPFFEPQQTFTAQGFSESHGIAVDAATGTVYATERGNDKVAVFTEVTLPDVTTGPGSGRETVATLSGTVNPEGEPTTSCEFEYGTTTSYGHTAPCASSPGAGSKPVAVSAELTGLQPRTVYHYRLVAANSNGAGHGSDQTFTTLSAPVVEDESAVEVTSSGATFQGLINPGGAATSYRFEYGTTIAYGASVPSPEGSLAPALVGRALAARAVLQPGTTYHYHVVATSTLGSTVGLDRTITTQPAGATSALPDGRAWEMVSPPEKHAGVIEPLGSLSVTNGAITQASSSGSAITYVSDQSLLSAPQGEANLSQVLSTRETGGWASQDITTPHQGPTTPMIGVGSEYRLFSSDLSTAVVEPFGPAPVTPLSPEATERTPYLRDEASGAFLPLVTAANVPAGTKFGGNPEAFEGSVKFVDATPDVSHAVLSSKVPLSATPVEEGLYEWGAGRLQLVSVLPEGAPTPAGLGYRTAGNGDNQVRHAISDDGSRIFWTQKGSAGHLYMRDTLQGQTVQVDTVQGGASGAGEVKPEFQTASNDGSKVFFTDTQQLTEGAGAGSAEPDLYECQVAEVAGKPACQLKDLTVDTNPGESAAVQGTVVGASEDGSYVYFVADGVLGDGREHGAATGNCKLTGFGSHRGEGQCNLYVYHLGRTHLIAVLAGDDNPDWDLVYSPDLLGMTARTSPDGRYLAFMSQRSLTGYDNTDASSGKPDQEVFLYHAGTDRLICASCDPTGARPAGVYQTEESGPKTEQLWDPHRLWVFRSVAASVPTWVPVNSSYATYQPRYLSNSGRLFFDSPDALVPQASNHQQDVYEYEPPGVGSCTSGSETFHADRGGCLDLISSGAAAGESVFLDASAAGGRETEPDEGGGDVFFLTTARLTSQDVDEQRDVYDAHECTSVSPCLALPAAAGLPPCTTGEACRPGGSPAWTPPGPAATSSVTGEDSASQPSISGRPGRLTRVEKLARAIRDCRKRYLREKRKRVACERQARRRYAARRSLRARHGKSTGRRG